MGLITHNMPVPKQLQKMVGQEFPDWMATGSINVTDHMTASDGNNITNALKKSIELSQPGYVLKISPLYDRYFISEEIVIDKNIKLEGFWSRIKNSARGIFETFGSVLVVDPLAPPMESVIKVTAQYVQINGISLKSRGYTGKGFNFEEAHMCYLNSLFASGFEHGYYAGLRANHIFCYNSYFTDNKYGIMFGYGNGFDFGFYTTSSEGNVVGDVCLPKNQSVENVYLSRCHLGFSDYAIWQDPETTTGDGFSVLCLDYTPIERPKKAFVNVQNIGGFTARGYWSWWEEGTLPSTPGAILIKNVASGPIDFDVKLEPRYPNINCENLFHITGYCNYMITVKGRLSGFAKGWFNYGAQLPMKYVWINGMQFASQDKGIRSYNPGVVTENVLEHKPLVPGLFQVMVTLRVTTPCTPNLKMIYNNGAGVVNTNLVPLSGETGVLPVGSYHYPIYFIEAYQHNSIRVEVSSNVASSCRVSASLKPVMDMDPI